ncbi:hypothetical protein ADUPG1_014241 [Aduncisulcus paluster]|uniref:S1 motif domain-containing protein n=1 Tax=Aduncisulcus paluster TaxID=2918883 RepID=A0ABQ5KD44_9EUKA|nr:hypothetical protein ADUPG1_014241 [Aduncisulcus paluster]
MIYKPGQIFLCIVHKIHNQYIEVIIPGPTIVLVSRSEISDFFAYKTALIDKQIGGYSISLPPLGKVVKRGQLLYCCILQVKTQPISIIGSIRSSIINGILQKNQSKSGFRLSSESYQPHAFSQDSIVYGEVSSCDKRVIQIKFSRVADYYHHLVEHLPTPTFPHNSLPMVTGLLEYEHIQRKATKRGEKKKEKNVIDIGTPVLCIVKRNVSKPQFLMEQELRRAQEWQKEQDSFIPREIKSISSKLDSLHSHPLSKGEIKLDTQDENEGISHESTQSKFLFPKCESSFSESSCFLLSRRISSFMMPLMMPILGSAIRASNHKNHSENHHSSSLSQHKCIDYIEFYSSKRLFSQMDVLREVISSKFMKDVGSKSDRKKDKLEEKHSFATKSDGSGHPSIHLPHSKFHCSDIPHSITHELKQPSFPLDSVKVRIERGLEVLFYLDEEGNECYLTQEQYNNELQRFISENRSIWEEKKKFLDVQQGLRRTIASLAGGVSYGPSRLRTRYRYGQRNDSSDSVLTGEERVIDYGDSVMDDDSVVGNGAEKDTTTQASCSTLDDISSSESDDDDSSLRSMSGEDEDRIEYSFDYSDSQSSFHKDRESQDEHECQFSSSKSTILHDGSVLKRSSEKDFLHILNKMGDNLGFGISPKYNSSPFPVSFQKPTRKQTKPPQRKKVHVTNRIRVSLKSSPLKGKVTTPSPLSGSSRMFRMIEEIYGTIPVDHEECMFMYYMYKMRIYFIYLWLLESVRARRCLIMSWEYQISKGMAQGGDSTKCSLDAGGVVMKSFSTSSISSISSIPPNICSNITFQRFSLDQEIFLLQRFQYLLQEFQSEAFDMRYFELYQGINSNKRGSSKSWKKWNAQLKSLKDKSESEQHNDEVQHLQDLFGSLSGHNHRFSYAQSRSSKSKLAGIPISDFPSGETTSTQPFLREHRSFQNFAEYIAYLRNEHVRSKNLARMAPMIGHDGVHITHGTSLAVVDMVPLPSMDEVDSEAQQKPKGHKLSTRVLRKEKDANEDTLDRLDTVREGIEHSDSIIEDSLSAPNHVHRSENDHHHSPSLSFSEHPSLVDEIVSHTMDILEKEVRELGGIIDHHLWGAKWFDIRKEESDKRHRRYLKSKKRLEKKSLRSGTLIRETDEHYQDKAAFGDEEEIPYTFDVRPEYEEEEIPFVSESELDTDVIAQLLFKIPKNELEEIRIEREIVREKQRRKERRHALHTKQFQKQSELGFRVTEPISEDSSSSILHDVHQRDIETLSMTQRTEEPDNEQEVIIEEVPFQMKDDGDSMNSMSSSTAITVEERNVANPEREYPSENEKGVVLPRMSKSSFSMLFISSFWRQVKDVFCCERNSSIAFVYGPNSHFSELISTLFVASLIVLVFLTITMFPYNIPEGSHQVFTVISLRLSSLWDYFILQHSGSYKYIITTTSACRIL